VSFLVVAVAGVVVYPVVAAGLGAVVVVVLAPVTGAVVFPAAGLTAGLTASFPPLVGAGA